MITLTAGMRVTLPLGVAVLVHAACGEDAYRVLVRVPGDAARAARIEVALLRSCGELADVAEAPAAPMRLVEVTRDGGAPLGAVEPGSYGLHARAWDADCLLYAAGCDGVTVRAGTAGTLEVALREVAAGGCEGDRTCEEGICRERDRDGGAGSRCDEIYGGVRDYVRCSEEDGRCLFNVVLFEDTCGELCETYGASCVGAYANDTSEGGDPCAGDYEESCDTAAWDEICACTLP